MWGIFFAPRETFAALAERHDTARLGILCVAAMSLAWALFLAALAAQGHAPSGPLLVPIPRESYYAWEAWFVGPVYFAGFAVLTGVLTWLGRMAGGVGRGAQLALVAGLSMALPSVMLWLLPDVVVIATVGFDGLGGMMKYYVPFSLAWTVGLATTGVQAVHRLPGSRAFMVALVGTLLHWTVGMPFLR